MTVGAAKPSVEYIEDNVTTVFAVPFQFFDQDEIIVERIDGTADANDQVLMLGRDYTVSGGDGDVGSIARLVAAEVGATLRIHRHTHRTQLLDYEPGDDFPEEMHEEGLDRLEMQIQELEDEILDGEAILDFIAKHLVAGPGILIAYNDALNTITISAEAAADFPDCLMLSGDQQHWVGSGDLGGTGGLSAEDVEDIIASMIKAGAGISVSYDDAANQFTITNDAPGGAAGSVDPEQVQDIVGAFLRAGANITLAYDDAGNTLTITGAGGSGGGGSGSLSEQDESLVANGGYYELSDGFMFQWGVTNVAANSTPTIFYPKGFTSFGVPSGSGRQNDASNPNNCGIVGSSLTGFTVCNNSPNAVNFYWHAMGK